MTKRKSADLAPEQQSLNDVLEEFRQLDAAGPGQNAAFSTPELAQSMWIPDRVS